jgi:hypothetical protein
MGLMEVKDQFLNLVNQTQGLGGQMVRNQPLKNRFPSLLNIVCKKQAMIFEVFSTLPLNVSFRRPLIGNNLLEWNNLVSCLVDVELHDVNDTIT